MCKYTFVVACRFKGKRPLSYASEAGNHEIVAYLLSLEGVTPEGVAKDEVLIAMTVFLHTKCSVYFTCIYTHT